MSSLGGNLTAKYQSDANGSPRRQEGTVLRRGGVEQGVVGERGGGSEDLKRNRHCLSASEFGSGEFVPFGGGSQKVNQTKRRERGIGADVGDQEPLAVIGG